MWMNRDGQSFDDYWVITDLLAKARAKASAKPIPLDFAGTVFSLRACCGDLEAVIHHTFFHLITTAPSDVTVTVIDAQHSSTVNPANDLTWFGPEARDETGSARLFHNQELLCAWNNEGDDYLIISRSFTSDQLLLRENLRIILQPLLGLRGIDGLHGATIGDSETGVLLVGRGGSGKSSLTAFAASRGWNTTGDDFLLVSSRAEEDQKLRIGSLFGTAKLAKSSPSRALFDSGVPQSDGKDLVDLRVVAERTVVPVHRIAALMSCSVADESRLSPLGINSFLAATLPHSIGHTYFPERLGRTIRHAAKGLPIYALESGPDLGQTIDLVGKVLHL